VRYLKLYFATKNVHKYLEAREILSEYGLEVERLAVSKVEIQSESLEEIARFAVESIEASGAVFVEDAGLFVEALKGFPGPYSSYVYSTIGCRGLLKLMEGVRNRKAYFESAVALKLPDGRILSFEGFVEGVIAEEERGKEGFGFDPVFVPEGQDRTFAEMDRAEKCRISHRGRALRAMADWISRAL